MSYIKQVQSLVEEYEKTLKGKPLNPREAAYKLIEDKKWKLPISKEVDVLSRDISKALRTRYFISPDGKRIRKKHCVRSKELDGSGRQLSFWWDIDLAPPDFMLQSFQQRRSLSADTIYQMVKDKDYYNKYKNKAAPIELPLDFTEDVEERAMTKEAPPPNEDDDELIG
jgi:hypothetical protein